MIRQIDVTVPMAALGPEGLPALKIEQPPDLSPADRVLLGEQEGRALADRPASALPYRHQNHYDRKLSPCTVPGIELSNAHLRAIFLPTLGGRLWSLQDVHTGGELLFQPDGIQFGNLALRDAWFSGGIEWNLGMTGHWGLTSAPVGAGIVEVDGQQVLRLWAWERLTRMVWRMDAWLPEDSSFLFTSPRITNHRDDATPFYWWSNAAVPLQKSSRVLAPAATAVYNNYAGMLERVDYPDTADRSRPIAAPQAVDYFFDTATDDGAPHPAPWVAGVTDEGPGLLMSSSPELRGKKLFVWGNTRGGGKWQDWLNGTGRYYELQSGWARTQKEHISLEGGATASWVESFGAVNIDPLAEHCPASRSVEELLPLAGMAQAAVVFAHAVNEAPTVLHMSDGWGRVEVEAGFLLHDDATPFDRATLDAEQQAWLAVAGGASPSTVLDRSPQTGSEWEGAVLRAAPGARRSLHLGYAQWAKGKRQLAEKHWREALDGESGNAMVLHALTICSEDGWDAFDFAERAHEAAPEDDDLLVEYLQRASTVPTLVTSVVERLGADRQELPRVRVATARALVAQGRLAEARDIIDTLELPNLREVSTELADVWADYAAAAGIVDPLPEHLDFAMG